MSSEEYDDEQEFENLWWYKRKWARRIFSPMLYLTSWQYRFYRFLQKSPEERKKMVEARAKKIRKRPDFPMVRAEDVIGREAELAKVMVGVHYHVFRSKELRKASPVPPPKIFIIKGESGSGKSFFCEAVQREAFEEGLKEGLIINYPTLRPQEVYSMWYGSSAQRLSQFFDAAFLQASVVFIDEFQAFGKKFQSSSEVGMEETRVQTVLLEKFDELQKRNYRTVVLIGTNEYESLTETLRRRGIVGVIDLDTSMSKDVLTKIASRECERYGITLSPAAIINVLEESLRALGVSTITPADVVNAFQVVVNSKSAPIQEGFLKRLRGSGPKELPPLSSLITLEDFRAAARKIKSYTSSEKTEAAKKSVIKVRPKERYKDVGGLHGVKDEIMKEIGLALNPDLALKANYIPPKGYLFYGPPGTGKTLMAKALAGENDVWFYNISGPSIIQGMYGDPEKTIRDIFDDARKNAPSIIFFDEMDSVAPKRGTHDPVMDRIVSQLLTEMDGFVPLTGVVVIGTTNRMDVLDPALLERFTKHFEFPYPKNREEKREIIEIHLRDYKDALAPGLTVDQILDVFDKKTLSPRKIEDTINDANRLRAKELEAISELVAVVKRGDMEGLNNVKSIFAPDLKRASELLGFEVSEKEISRLETITPSNYPLRLYHFEKALENAQEEGIEEARQMIESTVRAEKPEVGRSYGLVALGESAQSGLVSVVEVLVNPNGSGKVYVVGSEAGESVRASAEDAFIYINSISSWKYKNYDVYVELVTPAKGMEKQPVGFGGTVAPVSGPSAGLAIGIAMISAFINHPVDPSVVITGALTAKGEVWPVGGLDYRGSGKIEAALQDKYAKKLIIPEYNYMHFGDVGIEEVLEKRKIKIVPVRTLLEAVTEALVGGPDQKTILSSLNGEVVEKT
ncbi:MAG: AAA family ATPase [Thermoprotei archaeon]|jgi:SpoVK/Ycf46/Vps4 family AAA+-type ATPase